jgi:arylsulfatase A-like enzyme
MRWQPLGFVRDTPAAKIEDYFREHRGERWFFYAEPYPTHLPYNPPEAYFRKFLDEGFEPSAASMQRLEVVRSRLIVRPSGVISKMEAGEADPIPDDDADEAHKRTVGEVDLQTEDAPAVRALYDGEARVFDDLVGRWLAALEETGQLDETLIILTADHGEELMERGHVGHCSCNLKGTLYDESIRVPLILRYPERLPAGRVVGRQVSHIDIMPTIYDLLGLQTPEAFEGESLMALIDGRESGFREEVFAETTPAGWQALAADGRELWCVRTDRHKLIARTDRDRPQQREWELYDLRADPGETRNLAGHRPQIEAPLREKLEGYIRHARRLD